MKYIQQKYNPGICLLILLALTMFIYWPGLAGPLILDDVPNLEPLRTLESGTATWIDILSENGYQLRDRPISILSFILNWQLTGPDIWYLKFTNLLIHICCGCLIFIISGLLLRQPVTGIETKSWWVALLITAMWLLSPIHVSTTLYIIQRMAQLSTLFILFGLLSYLFGRQKIVTKPVIGYLFIFFSFLIFWPLASYSKQNGALFPLLVLIIELYFFSRISSKQVDIQRLRIFLIASVLLPLIFVVAKISVNPESLLGGYSIRDFTIYERLMTQPRILFDYLANILLLPGGSGLGLFHDDFIKSKNLLTPITTIFSIVAWLLILMLSFYKVGTRTGAALFGLVFFIAAHTIESSIFPLELYFEHRNYLPGIGIFISAGIIINYTISLVRFKKLLLMICLLIPLGYAVITSYRVYIWQSWDTILYASEKNHPHSRRTQAGLAIINIRKGDLNQVAHHLEIADRLDNYKRTSGIAIKYVIAYCFADKNPPESVYHRLDLLDTVTDDIYTKDVFRWFIDTVETRECENTDLKRIIDILHSKIIKLEGRGKRNNNWLLHFYMAKLFAYQEEWGNAQHHLEKVIVLRPGYTPAKSLSKLYQLKSENLM